MKEKIFLVLALLIFLILILNGCSHFGNSHSDNILVLKDKMQIPQEKCKLLDKYVLIYERGCPHCENVMPRIEQIEQEFNVSFKKYDLAVKEDFEAIRKLKIIPQGVPCVIINCKVYLGDGYSVKDFEEAILANKK